MTTDDVTSKNSRFLSDGISRAGIIPYYIKDGEALMYFMKPSDFRFGGYDFQCCKGRIDPGENAKEAALREGSEELGLRSDNIVKLWYLGEFLKKNFFYVCKIDDPTKFNTPHFETGDTKWMTIDQYVESGRPLHKGVVKAAYVLIKKKERLNITTNKNSE
jgi:8-oxo-dGTP pyrophosphatase MutT (NUDIX family)